MKRLVKPSVVNLDTLSPQLANLRAVAGDVMMQDAFAIVRERLSLDAEKLALLIIRVVNPDEILGEGEEGIVRNVSAPTLRSMKDRQDIPRVVNG